jgi:hypothetical protein
MKITELFNKHTDKRAPATIQWDMGPEMTVARMYDRQGNELDVKFVWSNENTIDIDFEREGSIDTTGQGDEIWIFASVIHAVREFMKKYGSHVDTVYFTGAEDRKTLYHRIVQRIGQEYGFTRANRRGSGVFKLKRTPARSI